MDDVADYSYRATWSAEDGEYLGTCDEFPSLSWLAASQDDALAGVRNLVRDAVDDLTSAGERAP